MSPQPNGVNARKFTPFFSLPNYTYYLLEINQFLAPMEQQSSNS